MWGRGSCAERGDVRATAVGSCGWLVIISVLMITTIVCMVDFIVIGIRIVIAIIMIVMVVKLTVIRIIMIIIIIIPVQKRPLFCITKYGVEETLSCSNL